jgi:riboflavin biosynthesis pyrimidine reductase
MVSSPTPDRIAPTCKAGEVTIADLPNLPQTMTELAEWYGDAPRGVRANMVQSVDGAGAFDGRTKRITDEADQTLLKYLRGHADAVLVGGATVQAEGYGPVRLDAQTRAKRRGEGYGEVPPLVIVTARALLSPDLKAFTATDPRAIVVTLTSAAAAAEHLSDVADVIMLDGDEIDPAAIIGTLRDRGLHRILCEGGPFVLSRFIEADLVDDMCLTVSPYLAGSQPTTPQPASAMTNPTSLRLRHVLTHEDFLYLRYSRP